eukprot:756021-Hanusia_phi.AAC.2
MSKEGLMQRRTREEGNAGGGVAQRWMTGGRTWDEKRRGGGGEAMARTDALTYQAPEESTLAS